MHMLRTVLYGEDHGKAKVVDQLRSSQESGRKLNVFLLLLRYEAACLPHHHACPVATSN